MSFPNITILIVTFNRLDVLKKTVEALMANLDYPKDKLHWLIADDSSPDNYVEKIKTWDCWKDTDLEFSVTPGNSGWGANVNQALKKVHTELIFQIEDDYILTKKLDLKEGVALLISTPAVAYLRYRGHGGNDLLYCQREAIIEGAYPGYACAKNLPGRVQYLLLHSGSQSVYLYTHGCHLKSRDFHKFYGEYPEHLRLGLTEEAFAANVKRMMSLENAPQLAILPEWINMYFDHIGISRQHTEYDVDRSNNSVQ